MRLLYTFLSVVLFTAIAIAQDGKIDEEFASLLKFDQPLIELGDVKKGNKVDSVIYFTNVSDHDVQIEFISVCECTETTFPEEVIKPGEKGKIEFTFDSTEKEKSEEVVLDILLYNKEAKTGYQIVEQAKYSFNLIQ